MDTQKILVLCMKTYKNEYLLLVGIQELVDGHDMKKISDEINDIGHKPVCIILDTIKGKGVSFMEDPSWHCKVPTDNEYEIAMKELGV